jgi:hypothetical protein
LGRSVVHCTVNHCPLVLEPGVTRADNRQFRRQLTTKTTQYPPSTSTVSSYPGASDAGAATSTYSSEGASISTAWIIGGSSPVASLTKTGAYSPPVGFIILSLMVAQELVVLDGTNTVVSATLWRKLNGVQLCSSVTGTNTELRFDCEYTLALVNYTSQKRASVLSILCRLASGRNRASRGLAPNLQVLIATVSSCVANHIC